MKRLVFLFVLSFCVFCQGVSESNSEVKELTKEQRWALGASGMLASRNHMKFDSLASFQTIDEPIVESWKHVLKEWWGIENREGLLDDLEWLENEGHRIKFEEMGVTIALMVEEGPTVTRAEYEKLVKENKKFRGKVAVVTKYYEVLGEKSLYGWDITRYICLCRWGFISGYITEAEAWERIMPAAGFLQQIFDSWKDLGKNYLIGRKFWSPEKKDHYLYEDAYMRLLDMPDSPWKELPWDLPLGDEDNDLKDTEELPEDSNSSTSTGNLAIYFWTTKEPDKC